MKVIRQRTGQSAMIDDEALISDDNLVIDRAVYKQLSSLTDMKTLAEPTVANDEFDRFLIEMQKIHVGDSVSTDVEALDAYLGSLGLTLTYPFPQDTYNVEAWVSATEVSEYRNVSTVSGGTEYNLVTDVDGVDYNVIHDTSI